MLLFDGEKIYRYDFTNALYNYVKLNEFIQNHNKLFNKKQIVRISKIYLEGGEMYGIRAR